MCRLQLLAYTKCHSFHADDELAVSFVKTLKALGLSNLDKPGYFHPGFVATLFEQSWGSRRWINPLNEMFLHSEL